MRLWRLIFGLLLTPIAGYAIAQMTQPVGGPRNGIAHWAFPALSTALAQ